MSNYFTARLIFFCFPRNGITLFDFMFGGKTGFGSVLCHFLVCSSMCQLSNHNTPPPNTQRDRPTYLCFSDALPTCDVVIASDRGCMSFSISVRVFPIRAMLHLCTRLDQTPNPPTTLSQASRQPEPSIKLALNTQWWGCGVCPGQRRHINLCSERPTRTATLAMMRLPQTKVSWEKVAACSVQSEYVVW